MKFSTIEKEIIVCLEKHEQCLCCFNNTVMVKRLRVVSDDSTLFTLHILSVYNPLFLSSLQLLFPVISNIKTWLSTTLVPYTVFQSTGWQERTNFANLIFEFLWELVIIWEAISNTPFSVSPDIHKGGSRKRVQGVRPPHPPPPWDDLRFSKTTCILPKKNYVVYWCRGRARDEWTPS